MTDPSASSGAVPRRGPSAFGWIALAIAVLVASWPFIRTSSLMPPPGDLPAAETELGYPDWSGRVVAADDRRGTRGPEVVVDTWVTGAVPLTGRVVVVDFWATWCGPCVASIPHMNELAEAFGDRVSFVGLSNEPRAPFDKGMSSIRRTPADFSYALALDPGRRSGNAIGLRAIPHAMVLSRDGIVRWQGNPRKLNAETLAAIVDADAAQAAGSAPVSADAEIDGPIRG